MIPRGYLTIPEVLFRLENQGKSPANILLEAGMLGGLLRVFNARNLWRVPREDLQALSRCWKTWFPTGRVPKVPTPAFDSDDYGTFDWDAVEVRYSTIQFVLSEQEVDRWLAAPVAKTGAPGRPSCMSIVMEEFERRRREEKCEASREAEGQALAIWLRETHPAAPQLSPKTIQNKLPADFQPYNSSLPKL